MNVIDKNNKQITNGDIIDLHQTVNGQNLVVVLDIDNLDVRYLYNMDDKYQYDKEELFRACKYSGEVEFEIIGKIIQ
jgi:hypothetical protein